MSNGLTHREPTATQIRTLLSGGSPNGAPSEVFGPYRDIIESLLLAHASGGTPQVRQAWNDLLQRHPDLAELIASDQTGADTWQIYTLADAYQPRPPREYVVDGLFARSSVSIMYGAPGTLKSLLLADLAVCVAAGLPWLPPPSGHAGTGRTTRQAPVLWGDFDNGLDRTHERFEALGRARGLEPTIPLHYVSMPSPWPDARQAGGLAVLQQHMNAYEARLVILDHLSAVKGSVDENSSDMALVMAHFRQLVEQTGAALILIHHQRKANGTKGRAGDQLRGHSSIEPAIDLALLVERSTDAASLTVCSTKVRGPEVRPFGASFTYAHKPGSTELAQARFFAPAEREGVSTRGIEQVVMDIVGAQPDLNKERLKTAVQACLTGVGQQVGRKRIGEVIDRLVREGALRERLGARGAHLYELPH